MLISKLLKNHQLEFESTGYCWCDSFRYFTDGEMLDSEIKIIKEKGKGEIELTYRGLSGPRVFHLME